jgi:hypothetical protein
MAIPTSGGFLIFDPRSDGYGIAQLQAREIPTRLTGDGRSDARRCHFSFLAALPWPLAMPLFELKANPRADFFGHDGNGVWSSSSFLKVLSYWV